MNVKKKLEGYRDIVLYPLQDLQIKEKEIIFKLNLKKDNLCSSIVDGMPHSSSVGSNVEEYAIENVTKECILQRKLKETHIKIDKLIQKKKEYYSVLNVLSDKERFIIKAYYFTDWWKYRVSWAAILKDYNKQFRKKLKTGNSIKYIFKKAIKKMEGLK